MMKALRRSCFATALALLAIAVPNVAQEVSRESIARTIAKTNDPVELRRSLVFMGEKAIPGLFEALALGHVPAYWRRGTDFVLDLSQEQLEVVQSTLGILPRKSLRTFLFGLAAEETSIERRLEAIRLLGEIGERGDLELLMALSQRPEVTTGVVPRALRAGVRAALERLLSRGVLKVRDLRGVAATAPVGLATTVVRVLGSMPTPDASRVLAALLGSEPLLDPIVLAELAARGLTGNALIDADTREAVRTLFDSASGAALAAAVRAAGVLLDEDAVGALLSLGSHETPAVSRNAFVALAAITGVGYGEDLVRWRGWYAAEMRWWEVESPQVLIALETARGVEFTSAIVDALKRRLFRDRIAASLVLRLRDEHPACIQLTCHALGQLQATFAVNDLALCLEHADREVRRTAWETLRRITGRDLPPVTDRWVDGAGI